MLDKTLVANHNSPMMHNAFYSGILKRSNHTEQLLRAFCRAKQDETQHSFNNAQEFILVIMQILQELFLISTVKELVEYAKQLLDHMVLRLIFHRKWSNVSLDRLLLGCVDLYNH